MYRTPMPYTRKGKMYKNGSGFFSMERHLSCQYETGPQMRQYFPPENASEAASADDRFHLATPSRFFFSPRHRRARHYKSRFLPQTQQTFLSSARSNSAETQNAVSSSRAVWCKLLEAGNPTAASPPSRRAHEDSDSKGVVMHMSHHPYQSEAPGQSFDAKQKELNVGSRIAAREKVQGDCNDCAGMPRQVLRREAERTEKTVEIPHRGTLQGHEGIPSLVVARLTIQETSALRKEAVAKRLGQDAGQETLSTDDSAANKAPLNAGFVTSLRRRQEDAESKRADLEAEARRRLRVKARREQSKTRDTPTLSMPRSAGTQTPARNTMEPRNLKTAAVTEATLMQGSPQGLNVGFYITGTDEKLSARAQSPRSLGGTACNKTVLSPFEHATSLTSRYAASSFHYSKPVHGSPFAAADDSFRQNASLQSLYSSCSPSTFPTAQNNNRSFVAIHAFPTAVDLRPTLAVTAVNASFTRSIPSALQRGGVTTAFGGVAASPGLDTAQGEIETRAEEEGDRGAGNAVPHAPARCDPQRESLAPTVCARTCASSHLALATAETEKEEPKGEGRFNKRSLTTYVGRAEGGLVREATLANPESASRLSSRNASWKAALLHRAVGTRRSSEPCSVSKLAFSSGANKQQMLAASYKREEGSKPAEWYSAESHNSFAFRKYNVCCCCCNSCSSSVAVTAAPVSPVGYRGIPLYPVPPAPPTFYDKQENLLCKYPGWYGHNYPSYRCTRIQRCGFMYLRWRRNQVKVASLLPLFLQWVAKQFLAVVRLALFPHFLKVHCSADSSLRHKHSPTRSLQLRQKNSEPQAKAASSLAGQLFVSISEHERLPHVCATSYCGVLVHPPFRSGGLCEAVSDSSNKEKASAQPYSNAFCTRECQAPESAKLLAEEAMKTAQYRRFARHFLVRRPLGHQVVEKVPGGKLWIGNSGEARLFRVTPCALRSLTANGPPSLKTLVERINALTALINRDGRTDLQEVNVAQRRVQLRRQWDDEKRPGLSCIISAVLTAAGNVVGTVMCVTRLLLDFRGDAQEKPKDEKGVSVQKGRKKTISNSCKEVHASEASRGLQRRAVESQTAAEKPSLLRSRSFLSVVLRTSVLLIFQLPCCLANLLQWHVCRLLQPSLHMLLQVCRHLLLLLNGALQLPHSLTPTYFTGAFSTTASDLTTPDSTVRRRMVFLVYLLLMYPFVHGICIPCLMVLWLVRRGYDTCWLFYVTRFCGYCTSEQRFRLWHEHKQQQQHQRLQQSEMHIQREQWTKKQKQEQVEAFQRAKQWKRLRRQERDQERPQSEREMLETLYVEQRRLHVNELHEKCKQQDEGHKWTGSRLLKEKAQQQRKTDEGKETRESARKHLLWQSTSEKLLTYDQPHWVLSLPSQLLQRHTADAKCIAAYTKSVYDSTLAAVKNAFGQINFSWRIDVSPLQVVYTCCASSASYAFCVLKSSIRSCAPDSIISLLAINVARRSPVPVCGFTKTQQLRPSAESRIAAISRPVQKGRELVVSGQKAAAVLVKEVPNLPLLRQAVVTAKTIYHVLRRERYTQQGIVASTAAGKLKTGLFSTDGAAAECKYKSAVRSESEMDGGNPTVRRRQSSARCAKSLFYVVPPPCRVPLLPMWLLRALPPTSLRLSGRWMQWASKLFNLLWIGADGFARCKHGKRREQKSEILNVLNGQELVLFSQPHMVVCGVGYTEKLTTKELLRVVQRKLLAQSEDGRSVKQRHSGKEGREKAGKTQFRGGDTVETGTKEEEEQMALRRREGETEKIPRSRNTNGRRKERRRGNDGAAGKNDVAQLERQKRRRTKRGEKNFCIDKSATDDSGDEDAVPLLRFKHPRLRTVVRKVLNRYCWVRDENFSAARHVITLNRQQVLTLLALHRGQHSPTDLQTFKHNLALQQLYIRQGHAPCDCQKKAKNILRKTTVSDDEGTTVRRGTGGEAEEQTETELGGVNSANNDSTKRWLGGEASRSRFLPRGAKYEPCSLGAHGMKRISQETRTTARVQLRGRALSSRSSSRKVIPRRRRGTKRMPRKTGFLSNVSGYGRRTGHSRSSVSRDEKARTSFHRRRLIRTKGCKDGGRERRHMTSAVRKRCRLGSSEGGGGETDFSSRTVGDTGACGQCCSRYSSGDSDGEEVDFDFIKEASTPCFNIEKKDEGASADKKVRSTRSHSRNREAKQYSCRDTREKCNCVVRLEEAQALLTLLTSQTLPPGQPLWQFVLLESVELPSRTHASPEEARAENIREKMSFEPGGNQEEDEFPKAPNVWSAATAANDCYTISLHEGFEEKQRKSAAHALAAKSGTCEEVAERGCSRAVPQDIEKKSMSHVDHSRESKGAATRECSVAQKRLLRKALIREKSTTIREKLLRSREMPARATKRRCTTCDSSNSAANDEDAAELQQKTHSAKTRSSPRPAAITREGLFGVSPAKECRNGKIKIAREVYDVSQRAQRNIPVDWQSTRSSFHSTSNGNGDQPVVGSMVIFRIHHTVADGIALTNMFLSDVLTAAPSAPYLRRSEQHSRQVSLARHSNRSSFSACGSRENFLAATEVREQSTEQDEAEDACDSRGAVVTTTDKGEKPGFFAAAREEPPIYEAAGDTGKRAETLSQCFPTHSPSTTAASSPASNDRSSEGKSLHGCFSGPLVTGLPEAETAVAADSSFRMAAAAAASPAEAFAPVESTPSGSGAASLFPAAISTSREARAEKSPPATACISHAAAATAEDPIAAPATPNGSSSGGERTTGQPSSLFFTLAVDPVNFVAQSVSAPGSITTCSSLKDQPNHNFLSSPSSSAAVVSSTRCCKARLRCSQKEVFSAPHVNAHSPAAPAAVAAFRHVKAAEQRRTERESIPPLVPPVTPPPPFTRILIKIISYLRIPWEVSSLLALRRERCWNTLLQNRRQRSGWAHGVHAIRFDLQRLRMLRRSLAKAASSVEAHEKPAQPAASYFTRLGSVSLQSRVPQLLGRIICAGCRTTLTGKDVLGRCFKQSGKKTITSSTADDPTSAPALLRTRAASVDSANVSLLAEVAAAAAKTEADGCCPAAAASRIHVTLRNPPPVSASSIQAGMGQHIGAVYAFGVSSVAACAAAVRISTAALHIGAAALKRSRLCVKRKLCSTAMAGKKLPQKSPLASGVKAGVLSAPKNAAAAPAIKAFTINELLTSCVAGGICRYIRAKALADLSRKAAAEGWKKSEHRSSQQLNSSFNFSSSFFAVSDCKPEQRRNVAETVAVCVPREKKGRLTAAASIAEGVLLNSFVSDPVSSGERATIRRQCSFVPCTRTREVSGHVKKNTSRRRDEKKEEASYTSSSPIIFGRRTGVGSFSYLAAARKVGRCTAMDCSSQAPAHDISAGGMRTEGHRNADPKNRRRRNTEEQSRDHTRRRREVSSAGDQRAKNIKTISRMRSAEVSRTDDKRKESGMRKTEGLRIDGAWGRSGECSVKEQKRDGARRRGAARCCHRGNDMCPPAEGTTEVEAVGKGCLTKDAHAFLFGNLSSTATHAGEPQSGKISKQRTAKTDGNTPTGIPHNSAFIRIYSATPSALLSSAKGAACCTEITNDSLPLVAPPGRSHSADTWGPYQGGKETTARNLRVMPKAATRVNAAAASHPAAIAHSTKDGWEPVKAAAFKAASLATEAKLSLKKKVPSARSPATYNEADAIYGAVLPLQVAREKEKQLPAESGLSLARMAKQLCRAGLWAAAGILQTVQRKKNRNKEKKAEELKQSQQLLPDLNIVVPVNLRTTEEESFQLRNHFTSTVVQLAPADLFFTVSAYERLLKVQARLRKSVKSAGACVFELMEKICFSTAPDFTWFLHMWLTNKLSILLSNVPGPSELPRIHGRQVYMMHFIGGLVGKIGINASAFSYANSLDLVLHIDRAVLDSPEFLRQCILDEYLELEQMCVAACSSTKSNCKES